MQEPDGLPADAPIGLTPRIGIALALGTIVAWTAYVALGYAVVINRSAGKMLHELIRTAIFVLPGLAVACRRVPDPLHRLGITARPVRGLGVGFGIGLAYAAAATGLAMTFEGRTFRANLSWLDLPWTGVSIATVVEEFAFRSVLLTSLIPLGRWLAVTASSVLFAALHVPGWVLLGLFSTGGAMALPFASIVVLGLVLGVVFLQTRSLWACVIIHAFHNIAASLTA